LSPSPRASAPLLALTRAVSAAIGRCALTHIPRAPIDLAAARAEHAAYEAALSALGATIMRLPEAPELPDAVFVEDTAVVLDRIAVIARSGEPSRRLETAAVAAALSAHRRLEAIEPPGTLDGGDVLRIGGRLFVGRSARTNDAGIEQLGAAAAGEGLEVVPVAVRGCLHLKSGISEVAPETVLVNRAWIDPAPFAGLALIDIDPAEPFAANALRIGGAVIHAAHFPRTRARLAAAGIRVLPVPQGELAKAEGGVTCGCLLVPAAAGALR